jgi:hypothetical protein
MQTAKGTKCNGSHEFNGKRDTGIWDVYEMNGRRYTVCAHRVGDTYCGALIDVTDGPVVICCGDEQNHRDVSMGVVP